MLKVLTSFVAAYILLIGVLGLAFLFLVPVGTSKEIYSSIPSFVYGASIRRASFAGDVTLAAELHRKQAGLAARLGLNAGMISDLTQQSWDVVSRLRGKKQYSEFLPWLGQLKEMAPENLLANLLWAEARVRSIQDVDAETLIKLRNTVPALDWVYRLALDQGVRARDQDALQHWCALYRESRMGGLDPKEFQSHAVAGQGLSSFQLELVGRDGRPVTNTSFAIRLNETVNYDFEIHNIPVQDSLIFHFPFFPGIGISIDTIEIDGQDGSSVYQNSELFILPKTGYLITENLALITSMSGETLEIIPRRGKFAEGDVIRLKAKFVRLGLSNVQACLDDIK